MNTCFKAIILILLSSCTYVYTIGIQTTEDRYIKKVELKKGAEFDKCYHEGHYVVGFYSPVSPKPKQYTGKDVVSFEVLKIERK